MRGAPADRVANAPIVTPGRRTATAAEFPRRAPTSGVVLA